MLKIGIIIGSTRPGRVGDQVGKWVYENAIKRDDAEFELIDLVDYNLPLYDEPNPAGMQQYTKDHTKRWSKKIAEKDGYIIITPEYNHGPNAALKNALDFLAVEWGNKAVGFVSYGSYNGARAVENLRMIVSQFSLADVREQVSFNLFTDFENLKIFKPDPKYINDLDKMISKVIRWSGALKTIR